MKSDSNRCEKTNGSTRKRKSSVVDRNWDIGELNDEELGERKCYQRQIKSGNKIRETKEEMTLPVIDSDGDISDYGEFDKKKKHYQHKMNSDSISDKKIKETKEDRKLSVVDTHWDIENFDDEELRERKRRYKQRNVIENLFETFQNPMDMNNSNSNRSKSRSLKSRDSSPRVKKSKKDELLNLSTSSSSDFDSNNEIRKSINGVSRSPKRLSKGNTKSRNETFSSDNENIDEIYGTIVKHKECNFPLDPLKDIKSHAKHEPHYEITKEKGREHRLLRTKDDSMIPGNSLDGPSCVPVNTETQMKRRSTIGQYTQESEKTHYQFGEYVAMELFNMRRSTALICKKLIDDAVRKAYLGQLTGKTRVHSIHH